MTINDISDLSSLQQLARSLWRGQSGLRGAAVFVGAGFSLNAALASEDTPQPPLWESLRKKMAGMLYPNSLDDAPRDALRIAEEFRAYFGQAALDEFIHSSIPDEAWYPGKAHARLLELPWVDVLTTNWDTLLERASRKVSGQSYEFVRADSDLAQARAPRIIKLHGTIGRPERFIFAEEDFRTYPTCHAAMVNLARQIFIENELCLLGFSGDDPNFLQWAGWVRDHLGSSSRRIFLVGVLNLSPAKRRLLEARNVAPIDLGPLVSGLPRESQHSVATSAFLTFLEDNKPKPAHAWAAVEEHEEPLDFTQEAKLLAKEVIELSEKWRSARAAYPGWLVCPAGVRRDIRIECSMAIHAFAKAAPELSRKELARAAYELAWRYDRAYMPLSSDLSKVIEELLQEYRGEASEDVPKEEYGLSQDELAFLHVSTLKEARENRDEPKFFANAGYMEKAYANRPEVMAELAYQQALWHKERLNFSELESWLEEIRGEDPVWKLRKAYLLVALRRWDDAERLVALAFSELREREGDARSSIWVRSRRTWSQWLLHLMKSEGSSEDAPSGSFLEEKKSKCDPWDELESLSSQINEAKTKRATDKIEDFVPLFEVGSYRTNRNSVRFISEAVVPISYGAKVLVETVGIPERFKYMRFRSSVDEVALFNAEPSSALYLKLVPHVRNERSELVIKHLSRTAVASIPAEMAASLVRTASEAIAYWRRKSEGRPGVHAEAIQDLILFITRLTPRLDDEGASQCFRQGLEIFAELTVGRKFIHGALAELFHHSAMSMSPKSRGAALLLALEAKQPVELGLQDIHDWPKPVAELAFLPIEHTLSSSSERWSSRVAEILKLAQGPVSKTKMEAVLSIYPLINIGAVTTEQLKELGLVVWSGLQRGEMSALPLLPHLLADPGFDDHKAHAKVVAKTLFAVADEEIGDLQHLWYIHAAAISKNPILPSAKQAEKMCWQLLKHRIKVQAKSFFSDHVDEDELRFYVGRVLSRAALSQMKRHLLTRELFDAVLSMVNQRQVYAAMEGLVYFLAGHKDVTGLVAERIADGLLGKEGCEVAAACSAMTLWHEMRKKKGWPQPPERLYEALVVALEARREAGLTDILSCCEKIATDFNPSDARYLRVKRAINRMRGETEYATATARDRWAVALPVIRGSLVRLARAMLKVQQDADLAAWIAAAEQDPLPEVRFAAKYGRI